MGVYLFLVKSQKCEAGLYMQDKNARLHIQLAYTTQEPCVAYTTCICKTNAEGRVAYTTSVKEKMCQITIL